MNTSYTRLNKISEEHNAALVVVSKTRSDAEIMEIYNQGHRTFGENRVPELLRKTESLPNDIQWHLIGHLQTNKVKSIVSKVDLIHSVDSIRLLDEIQKQATLADAQVNCLLQMKIAKEESKYGFSKSELDQFFSSIDLKSYDRIVFCGLMGMATLTDDSDQIRSEFNSLKTSFDDYKKKLNENRSFTILSMGMSGDYSIALAEGSTMLRVGSLVFED